MLKLNSSLQCCLWFLIFTFYGDLWHIHILYGHINEGTIHMQRQETNLHCLHIIMMKCHNLHLAFPLVLWKICTSIWIKRDKRLWISKLEHENAYYFISGDYHHMNLMHSYILYSCMFTAFKAPHATFSLSIKFNKKLSNEHFNH